MPPPAEEQEAFLDSWINKPPRLGGTLNTEALLKEIALRTRCLVVRCDAVLAVRRALNLRALSLFALFDRGAVLLLEAVNLANRGITRHCIVLKPDRRQVIQYVLLSIADDDRRQRAPQILRRACLGADNVNAERRLNGFAERVAKLDRRHRCAAGRLGRRRERR